MRTMQQNAYVAKSLLSLVIVGIHLEDSFSIEIRNEFLATPFWLC